MIQIKSTITIIKIFIIIIVIVAVVVITFQVPKRQHHEDDPLISI
jgi:uncharacterized protein YpmB